MTKAQMISANEFALAINKPYSTVTSWLTAGLIDGAEAITIGKLNLWQVPATAITTFKPPKRGRPKTKTKK